MPRAIQFMYQGRPLAGGAIFASDGPYIGSGHWASNVTEAMVVAAAMDADVAKAIADSDPDDQRSAARALHLAAQHDDAVAAFDDARAEAHRLNKLDEEANIAANRENFAEAYGVPAEEFEVLELPYNGSEPYCKEHGLDFIALPNEQTPDALPVHPAYLKRMADARTPNS